MVLVNTEVITTQITQGKIENTSMCYQVKIYKSEWI